MNHFPDIPVIRFQKTFSHLNQLLLLIVSCTLVLSLCSCQSPCRMSYPNCNPCGQKLCQAAAAPTQQKCGSVRPIPCGCTPTQSRFSKPTPAPVVAQPTPAVLPGSKVSTKSTVKESVYEDPKIPVPQTNTMESIKSETSIKDSANNSVSLDDPEAELDRVFDQNELSSGKMMQPRQDTPSSVKVLEVPQTETVAPAETAPAETVAPEKMTVQIPEETTVQVPAVKATQTQSDAAVQNTAETLAEIEPENNSEMIPAPASTETEINILEESIPSEDAPEALESDSALPQELPQEFPEVPFGDLDSLDSGNQLIPQESEISKPSGSSATISPKHRMSTLKKALKQEKESSGNKEPEVISGPEVNEHSILQEGASLPKKTLNISASSIIQAAGTASSKESKSNSKVQSTEWVVVDRPDSGIRLTAAEEPVMESVLTPPAEVDLNLTSTPTTVLPERPSFAQPADEYIIDSKSTGKKVEVKENRKVTVSGVEMDDNWQAETQNETGTYIYYNGLQGRATIQSPDPVYIYAPRFRAVRQLVDLNVDEQITTTGDLYTPTHVSTANRNLEASTTKRNLQVGTDTLRTVILQANGNAGTGILDGETAASVKTQEAVIAQENREITGPNAINGKVHALGAEGLIEVNAWTTTEEMQVFIDQQSASAAIRTESTPTLFTVQEGDHKQDVRIYKVVSKTSAKPGETVDFIIYFENTGHTPVGNITLVDNLPTRLEIVEDSAESSVDSNFTYEVNGNGSQTLRWEVTQPLTVGEKGAVKFKALVR